MDIYEKIKKGYKVETAEYVAETLILKQEGKTYKEIANVLQRSEPRISQYYSIGTMPSELVELWESGSAKITKVWTAFNRHSKQLDGEALIAAVKKDVLHNSAKFATAEIIEASEYVCEGASDTVKSAINTFAKCFIKGADVQALKEQIKNF